MLSKKLTRATPRTKREALQLSVMAHSRAQSGLDQNERNTYPRGPRYRAPDSGTAGRYASTLWSRNDANMALPPTPHSTFDMPPPFGYPNGGLSQKRRDEYHKEEDSHLGKRRRTAGGDDFRSSVVERESITGDKRHYTADPAGQNGRPLYADHPPPARRDSFNPTGQNRKPFYPDYTPLARRDSSDPPPRNQIEEIVERRQKALSTIRHWEDPQTRANMLSLVPRQFLDTTRSGLKSYYDSERQVLSKREDDKPDPVVGDIHEILDQQIYADPKKASLDNTRIVAGPESTHTI